MIKDDEVDTLLNDLFEVYGYDFTNYSKASLKRRIDRLFVLDKFPSFAEFRFRIKSDEAYLKRFVEEITVNVTEMFRDPSFYKVIRTEVLKILATYPLIRIWHAGCSTGEEVYSMAILLQEANLLHKSLLYATDLNPDVLDRARAGIFPLAFMKQYSENYILSGGLHDFSSYYTAKYDRVIFDAKLSKKMIFATHNLVCDRSFNHFQLILCRNVMIYFDRPLQDKVLKLFDDSLDPLGFIGLGAKETLRYSPVANNYSQLGKEKIWRKRA
ncbi:MAG: CheR family methyltransferase [Candidatus Dadabacteria bacterium]